MYDRLAPNLDPRRAYGVGGEHTREGWPWPRAGALTPGCSNDKLTI